MLGWNVNKSYISHKICDNKWGSKNKYKIRGGGGGGQIGTLKVSLVC